MQPAYAPRRDSDELGFVPLWRERSFLRTLLVFGGAALLPVALAPAKPAWPAAGLVLLSLLAAVDLGALAPAGGARADALRGLRFATLAAVAPLFLGLLAAAAGVVFDRWVALPLLAVGALLALAAIAPLEAVDPEGEAPRGGRALAAAGAALSLATASLWRAAAQGAEVRLGELPLSTLAASLLVALAAGCAVAAAGFVGGAALRRLRYRSFAAPRAAAAALLLAASCGIAAAGIAWF
jgi:hypothetical protein